MCLLHAFGDVCCARALVWVIGRVRRKTRYSRGSFIYWFLVGDRVSAFLSYYWGTKVQKARSREEKEEEITEWNGTIAVETSDKLAAAAATALCLHSCCAKASRGHLCCCSSNIPYSTVKRFIGNHLPVNLLSEEQIWKLASSLWYTLAAVSERLRCAGNYINQRKWGTYEAHQEILDMELIKL